MISRDMCILHIRVIEEKVFCFVEYSLGFKFLFDTE